MVNLPDLASQRGPAGSNPAGDLSNKNYNVVIIVYEPNTVTVAWFTEYGT